MTILNYTNSIKDEFAVLHFTGRDYSINGVLLTNQESKKEYNVGFEALPSSVKFSLTEVIAEGDITKDSTFSIKLLASQGKRVYMDIIVFSGRIDAKLDYTQNENSETGYVFG